MPVRADDSAREGFSGTGGFSPGFFIKVFCRIIIPCFLRGGAFVETSALFFPFDLFGSGGAGAGADLLADAFHEMLADNKRERKATRARSYDSRVRMRRLPLETLRDYQHW